MRFLRKIKPSRLVGDAKRHRHHPSVQGALVKVEPVMEPAPFDGDPQVKTTERQKQVAHNIMYVTNAWAIARIDLGRVESKEGVHLDEAGPVPAVALKHMEAGTTAYFEEEAIRVGNITRYERVFSEANPESTAPFPDVDELMRKRANPPPGKRLTLTIDAALLSDLVAAMGADQTAVTLTLDKDKFKKYTEGEGNWYSGAVAVDHHAGPVSPQPAEGLIMPMRPVGA